VSDNQVTAHQHFKGTQQPPLDVVNICGTMCCAHRRSHTLLHSLSHKPNTTCNTTSP
jgi:hypothetical protein